MTSPVAPASPTAPATLTPAQHARIRETAERFEASFLSSMFQSMFEGVRTDGAFGGGQAEGMWRSMLTDAMARQVVRTGGVGVSAAVAREMIRMQGAAAEAEAAASANAAQSRAAAAQAIPSSMGASR
jgi:Rod binding domain-containing protein